MKLCDAIEDDLDLQGWDKLIDLFLNVCAGVDEVFLVFDALDECDEHKNRPDTLDFLEALEQDSNIRVLITSRSYPSDIKEAFAEYPEIVIEASDDDIRDFIDAKIKKCRRTRAKRPIDNDLREHIIQSITAKSNGM